MEGKVQSLEVEIASLKDQLKATVEVEHAQRSVKEIEHTIEVEVQIKDIPIGVTMQAPVINVDGEIPKSDGALKRGLMLNMLNNRIDILKRISQDAYNAFTNLQAAKKMCKEEVIWLDHIF